MFFIYTGGYEVIWAPKFETRAEAEAWVNEVGGHDGWEESVEVVWYDREGEPEPKG